MWLVRTVGAVLVVTGTALGLAANRKRISADLGVVAGGQAAVLCAVDLFYPLIGRISPVYLLDALPEAVLVALWFAWYPERRTSGEKRDAV